MPSVKTKLVIKVIVDVFIVVAVALPVLLFYVIGEPFHRGFFCDDPSIRYPYKESTVTSGALYAIGTIIPIVAILIIEYIRAFKCPESEDYNKSQVWFWSLYRYVGVFLFGCALSHLSVDIAKYSLGRLRPHFIDVCRPDWDKIDCSGHNFITSEGICTAVLKTDADIKKMREARLSFMSGHASFSAFTMFFLIIYLQARFQPRPFHLIRPFIQFLAFGICVYTCFTRVSDYKHHWSDVLGGFMNGVVFAFFITLAVAGMWKRRRSLEISSGEMNMCPLNQPNGNRVNYQGSTNTTMGNV